MFSLPWSAFLRPLTIPWRPSLYLYGNVSLGIQGSWAAEDFAFHSRRVVAAVLEAWLFQCPGVSSISMEASDVVFLLVAPVKAGSSLGKSVTLLFLSRSESTAVKASLVRHSRFSRSPSAVLSISFFVSAATPLMVDLALLSFSLSLILQFWPLGIWAGAELP